MGRLNAALVLAPSIIVSAASTIRSLTGGMPLYVAFLLFIVKTIHVLFGVLLLTHLFIGSPTNDLVFLIAYHGMLLSWYIFKGECLLMYVESRLMYPSYKLGENPHLQDQSYGKLNIFIHAIFFFISVFVCYRYLSSGLRCSIEVTTAVVLALAAFSLYSIRKFVMT